MSESLKIPFYFCYEETEKKRLFHENLTFQNPSYSCEDTKKVYGGSLSCYKNAAIMCLLASDFSKYFVDEIRRQKGRISYSSQSYVKDNHEEDKRRKGAIIDEIVKLYHQLHNTIDPREVIDIDDLMKSLGGIKLFEDYVKKGCEDSSIEFTRALLALTNVKPKKLKTHTYACVIDRKTNKTSWIMNKEGNQYKEDNVISIYADNMYDVDKLKDLGIGPNAIEERTSTNDFKDEPNYYFNSNEFYKTTVEMPEMDAFVMAFHRTTIEKKTPLTPSISIEIAQRNANLVAIIMYISSISSGRSGHYIAIYKCNDVWYYFDDLTDGIRTIGKFDSVMKKYGNRIRESGVLYFYVSDK